MVMFGDEVSGVVDGEEEREREQSAGRWLSTLMLNKRSGPRDYVLAL